MFHSIINAVKKIILSMWRNADEFSREKALRIVDSELEELENIFGILVLGSYVGFPSPPMQVSLDLMPLMEKELILMTEKVDTGHEPLSYLFSTFDIE